MAERNQQAIENPQTSELVSVRDAESAVKLAKEAKTHLDKKDNLYDDPTMSQIIDKLAALRIKPDGPTIAELIALRAQRRVPKELEDSENLARDAIRSVISELAQKMPSEMDKPDMLDLGYRMRRAKDSFSEINGLHTSKTIAWLGIAHDGCGRQLAINAMKELHETAPYAFSWLRAAGLNNEYKKDGRVNPTLSFMLPPRTYVAWLGDNLQSAIKVQLAAIKAMSSEQGYKR